LKRGHDEADYVQKVRGDSQRLTQNLLNETERLRARLAALGAENAALAEKSRSIDALVAANETLRAGEAALRAEKLRFEEAVVQLREELAAAGRRYAALEQQLQEAEEESHRFSQDYLHVEQQNQNLANLYVASYRLHGTVDRGELMLALQEIVANLVGSEEMGVFELSETGRTLRLVGSLGLDRERYRELPADRGLIGQALRSGQTYVGGLEPAEGRSEGEEHLTACIPLFVEERPLGVIAIFRLLSHKPEIEDIDRELFELLAAQASVALYCTRLHAHNRAEVLRG
jgi:predicted O-linked N-acetylglucosamine transferase (SPINDLY family)